MRLRNVASATIGGFSSAGARCRRQDFPVARPEVRGVNVTVQQETEIRIELAQLP